MRSAINNQQLPEINPFLRELVFEVGETPGAVISGRAWSLRLAVLSRGAVGRQEDPGAELFGLAWTIAHFQQPDHFVVMLEGLWQAHVASIAPRPGTSRWASLRARAESSEFLELRASYLAALGIREQKSGRRA